MEEQYNPIKGLQLNARFYKDIQREWELCRKHQSTLNHLSITVDSMQWDLTDAMTFPQLKELQIFLSGCLAIDRRGHVKTYADSWQIKSAFGIIERWMAIHSFPVLEHIQILWSTQVELETIYYGNFERYDKDGPIYEIEHESEYLDISMDAVWYHFGEESSQLNVSWMKNFAIQKLHLACTIYEQVRAESYPFEITSARSFTQDEEDRMFELLNDYSLT